MQGKDMVALVAGASVGVAGGTLGAILACTAGGAALYRLLDQFGVSDQYVVLRQPAAPVTEHGDPQASPRSTPRSSPPGALPQANAEGVQASAWQAVDTLETTSLIRHFVLW